MEKSSQDIKLIAEIIYSQVNSPITDLIKTMKVVTFQAYSRKMREIFFDIDDGEIEKSLLKKYEYTTPIIFTVETYNVEKISESKRV